MLLTITFTVAGFITGYFVGANNPTAAVKAKIVKAAKDAAAKL